MTKSKTIAVALAAITLATTFTAIGGQAQAHLIAARAYELHLRQKKTATTDRA